MNNTIELLPNGDFKVIPSKLKVLHVGLMVNKKLNVGLSKAFRESCDYREVELNHQAIQELTRIDFNPDIVFVQVQNEKIGSLKTSLLNEPLQLLRDKGAFVINWTGDIRNDVPKWMYEFNADLTCFSNMRDVNNFRGKSDFLQIGIDPVNFNPNHKLEDLPARNMMPKGLPKVVFMGNNAGHFPLSRYRMDMVKRLQREFGDDFWVFGNGYPGSKGSLNASPADPYHMQSLESYIYRTSKVVISISHYNEDRYFSDRLLRAMGSGAFVLSHNYKGIEKDWDVGKDLDVFDNLDELVDKIEEHTEIKAINAYMLGREAANKVHNNHTYYHMVQDIINLYNKHK